jgi:hypothetical protein
MPSPPSFPSSDAERPHRRAAAHARDRTDRIRGSACGGRRTCSRRRLQARRRWPSRQRSTWGAGTCEEADAGPDLCHGPGDRWPVGAVGGDHRPACQARGASPAGVALAIAAAAAVSGAKSFVAVGEFAAELSQEALARLGARRHPVTGRYVAPHEATCAGRSARSILTSWTGCSAAGSPSRPIQPPATAVTSSYRRSRSTANAARRQRRRRPAGAAIGRDAPRSGHRRRATQSRPHHQRDHPVPPAAGRPRPARGGRDRGCAAHPS